MEVQAEKGKGCNVRARRTWRKEEDEGGGVMSAVRVEATARGGLKRKGDERSRGERISKRK